MKYIINKNYYIQNNYKENNRDNDNDGDSKLENEFIMKKELEVRAVNKSIVYKYLKSINVKK